MAQLQAAYYTDRLFAFWQKHNDTEKVEGLLQLLSRFEVELPEVDSNRPSPDPVLSVAKNFIMRGLPTKASVALEEVIADVLGRTERIEKLGKLSYKATRYQDNFDTLIYRALHVIDPRIQGADQLEPLGNWKDKTEVAYEEDFIQSILPAYFGKHMLQLFEAKCMAKDLLHEKTDLEKAFARLFKDSKKRFDEEVIDFTFRMPFAIKGKKGIMVEFDNVDHATYPQRELDEALAEAIHNENWEEIIRIDDERYTDIKKHLQPLEKFTSTGYYEFHKQNFEYPLYHTQDGLDALQIALTPIGVARIQRTILELIQNGNLSMYSAEWYIGVIERDVPCAQLAMLDLHQLLKSLFVLHGEGLQGSNMQSMPDIRLEVYHTKDFDQAKLNTAIPEAKLLSEFDKDANFDLLIDVSVLQRKGVKAIVPPNSAEQFVTIRSAHSVTSSPLYEQTGPIEYETIYKNVTATEKQVHPKALEALTYLTQSVFRTVGLRPKQVELFDLILQRKNTAGLLPPNYGKSLTFQLAALLQPAPSIVVTPLTTLTKNQLDTLWERGIERLHWVNSALGHEDEVDRALSWFETGESLFNYIAPEWFRKKKFRDSLSSLLENTGVAYCVIDEVHCTSEWSHDFRQEYFQLPQLAQQLMPDAAILGFSGTSFNNTTFDIQSQLGIGESSTVEKQMDADRFNSEVILVDLPQTRNAAIFSLAKNLLADRKQVKALQLASEKTKLGEKVFFFTPYNKGLLGVTDKQKDGLADKLKLNLPKLQIGAFTGTDRNYTDLETETVSVDSINESKETYRRFAKDEMDIVVTSSALGVGIHSESFQNIVHLNMPPSIESFVQRNGRGNRNGKPTHSVILYNNRQFSRKIEEVKISIDGKEELTQIEQTTTIDKEVLKGIYLNRFRGRKFDLISINEILNEISTADFRPHVELKARMERKYNISFNFLGHEEDDPKRILVFADKVNLALFRFEEKVKFVQMNTDIPDAETICEDIHQFILTSPSKDYYSWFFGQHKISNKKGIEKILHEFEKSQKIFQETDKPEINISYENDRIDRISELLRQVSSELFTEEVVLEAFQFAQSSSEFIANLHRTANVQLITEEMDLPKRLNELFYEVRRKENTLTAVRQLSTLGVIEDFILNEDKRQVEAVLSPVGNEYFVIQLFRYTERYVAKEKAHNVFEDIYKYKEPSVLRRTVRYLVDFVYDQIATSRLKSIESMASACEEIVAPENVKGEITFGDLIQLNLQAKYAHSAHQPNLVEDTDGFSKTDLELVKKYIEHSGKQRENWYHLENSSDTLLKKSPDNYLLLMLKSYSRFALANGDVRSAEQALSYFVKALKIAKEKENWSAEKTAQKVDEIAAWFVTAVPRLKHLKKAIAIRLHLSWLRDFNKDFLEGYSKV